MACSFPYIEKNFRQSNPEIADKLNKIGLDTWTEIKDSNLFTKKEGSYVFNKQGTIRREKQNQFVNSINDKLGGNVVTEANKKVAVNLVPIFNRFKLVEPTPTIQEDEVVLEPTTISEEPIFPKVDDLMLEWDEYEKILENPNKSSPSSFYLISKFRGFNSLEQYKEVATGQNPQAFSEYADQKLMELLKNFTDTVGIAIKDISEFQENYLERTGKMISASGIADLINKTIYVSEGNVDALTEEVAHFIVAMLPKDNPLYTAIDAYIENTPEFAIYYDVYLDKYQGNEIKTRDEIIGKVIKNVFQDKKEKAPLSLKTFINYILEYIRSIFSDKAFQYKQATASIKQMFFSESLVENLSDLDTSNEEMYKLSYELVGKASLSQSSPEKTIKVGLESVFENIVPQLESYAEKARQTGNTKGLQTANSILLKIKQNEVLEKDLDVLFVEIMDTISKSLSGINQSFGELQKNNYDSLTTLFAKGTGIYSPEQMNKLQNEEYTKRLRQIGSYITHIQNLKDFAITLKDIKQTVASLVGTDFKEIVSLLNPSLAKNADFIAAMNFISSKNIDDKIANIEKVYESSASIVVEGLLNATTTADQRAFMEKNNLGLLPTTVETADLNKNIIEGVKDNLTWLRSALSPTTMQNDVFTQVVNSFVNFVLRKAQEDTFKVEAEVLELQQEMGFTNQEFLSSKDEKGNLTFELLSKYNYTKFAKQKTEYILSKVLPELIKNGKITDNTKSVLRELVSQPFNSLNELYEIIANAHTLSELITDYNEFEYIDNYLRTAEKLYNLKRFVPSQGLSEVASDAIRSYISTAKRVYTEAFANPDFNWGSDEVNFVLSSELDAFDLYPALQEKIEEKRKLLEKQYYTFDPATTNIDTNPIFRNQYFKVEGLLNYYKASLGYVEQEGGLFDPSLIKNNKFGEEYLFELSGEDVDGIPATYVDEDYKKLEEEAADEKNKNNKQAIAKLKLIDKIKNFNKSNNNPTNALGTYLKRDSEYNVIKFFGKRYRLTDLVTRIAIPAAFAVYITPGLITGDWSIGNQIDFFTGLNSVSQLGVFLTNILLANQFMRVFTTFTDNFSREINSFKDIPKIFKVFATSLGVPYKTFNLEIQKEDANLNSEESIINYFKTLFNKIVNFFSSKKSVVNVPTTYQPLTLVPQIQKRKLPNAVRSTQFIDNFVQDVASTNDYNSKVSFEGVLKYMDIVNKKRTDIPVASKNYVENAYLNRVWYGNVAPNGALRKAVNAITSLMSKVFLTGNILADVKNFLQAQLPFIINSGPHLVGKAGYKAFIYSVDRMFNVVSNNKMAVEVDFMQQVKKRLRILQQGGITERDTGQSVATRKLRLSNARSGTALGESFISSMVVSLMLDNNKLIDEQGNTYDIARYFELKDGIFQLKEGAPTPFFNFLTKGQVQELSAEDLAKINPTGKINLSNLSEEGKKLLTPSSMDINNYVNISLMKYTDYFSQKTQGVYNTLDKPVLATTTVGHAFFQFGNHLVSNYKTSLGATRYNINTGELEQGFIRGSLSLLKDLTVATVSAPQKIKQYLDKDYKKSYEEENKNQIENINNFISLQNKSKIFALELLGLSEILAADFTVKEIKDLAEKIYNGELKFSDLGESKKSKDEIFKTLYDNYLQNKEVNLIRAKSLRKLATSILLAYGMFNLATYLLAKSMGADDEDDLNVWLKFIALLTQNLTVEAIFNFSGLGILQKTGFDLKGFTSQKLYGKQAYGDLGIYDPTSGLVSYSFFTENLRNLHWAIAAFVYNNVSKDGLLGYDENQFKKLKQIIGAQDLPYARPSYKIKTKPSGKKGVPGRVSLKEAPVNLVEQQILDYVYTPKLRDIYKQNPLKREIYGQIPRGGLEEMNYKLGKSYLRQTGGREIIEDIMPSPSLMEETKK